MTHKLIIITGQTATGKTKLALEYARKYNGELINSDSRQIYKHLDIITGKDLVHKHWLYDIVDPQKYFSSFDFVKLAIPIIKKLLCEGKTPVIVGGTYLYLKHLLYGVETENIPPNFKLREELNKKPITELQKKLQAINARSFSLLNQSDKNNPQRLIRKIEILTYFRNNLVAEPPRLRRTPSPRGTGEPRRLDEKLAKILNIPDLQIEFIGLKFKNKGDLRKVIEKRVEERLKHGAIEEVKNLLKLGYKETDPGLRTIGYQQILRYLHNLSSLGDAVNQWITKEVQYAKRQYTFMKKDKNIKWKDTSTSFS